MRCWDRSSGSERSRRPHRRKINPGPPAQRFMKPPLSRYIALAQLRNAHAALDIQESGVRSKSFEAIIHLKIHQVLTTLSKGFFQPLRSEERRVGKECRSRWS